MKLKPFFILSLPILLFATGCGNSSNNSPAPGTPAVAAQTTNCPAGQIYTTTYNCAPTQQGMPPGYGQNGYAGVPITPVYPQQGWGYGYNYSNWHYYGGYYYYW